MKDSNITKLSSLALEKVNSTDPYTTNAPSDGSLALGSIQTTDIPNLVNNENYSPAIPSAPGEDNYPIKDGTVYFNRDEQYLQYFYNGAPLNVAGSQGEPAVFSLDTPAADIVAGQVLTFTNNKDAINLTAADLVAGPFNPAANNESVILHENRRIKLRENGIKSTINNSSISDLGYIQFSNNTDENSEGFVYLDGNPTIVLQHQTSTSTTPYNNVCTTFTGGGAGESSSSVNAILEINSTSGGFLPSRLSTTQINALSVNSLDKGLIIYNSSTNSLNVCNGSTFDNIKVKPSFLYYGNSMIVATTLFSIFGTSLPPDGTICKITLVGAGSAGAPGLTTFSDYYAPGGGGGGTGIWIAPIYAKDTVFISPGGNTGSPAVQSYYNHYQAMYEVNCNPGSVAADGNILGGGLGGNVIFNNPKGFLSSFFSLPGTPGQNGMLVPTSALMRMSSGNGGGAIFGGGGRGGCNAVGAGAINATNGLNGGGGGGGFIAQGFSATNASGGTGFIMIEW